MPPASGLSDIGERPFPGVPRTVEEFSTFAFSLFVVVFGVRLVACFFSGEGEHYRADEARDEDERGSWVDCHQARCPVV